MSKVGVVAKVSFVLLSFGSVALADDRSAVQSLASRVSFYENAPVILIPGGGEQTNCADPTIIQGQGGDAYWYAYCTTDSLNDEDVDSSGVRRQHLVPMLRSADLVSWVYMGDAFAAHPSWVADGAGLWAPEIQYRNGQYYLYYTATDVGDAVSGEPGCNSDNAIGVATSASPLGPWVDHGSPVVEPRRGGGGCNFLWTYDPEVLVTSGGQSYMYFGSFYGGVHARTLSADGFSTDPASDTQITIPNRYEGSNVVEKDGYYYLFVSASNCCNGPLTGYQVFAGRSQSPLGPFVDRGGSSLLESHVGGTPVITQNGNRWVGPGHNSVFTDAAGNWYTLYHAVDDTDPYFAGSVGYTRRSLLLDRITWVDGWPQVREGLGPSDSPELAPLAKPGPSGIERTIYNAFLDALDPEAYLLVLDHLDTTRLQPVAASSDDFNGNALGSKWTWVRPPPATDYGVANGLFRFATQPGELFADTNNAAVLTEAAPTGNYLIEAKVSIDVPLDGCCFNYVSTGLVIYANDDKYIKLVDVSMWETRQTEFAKEVPAPTPGYPAYGSGVGGPPGQAATWLRIAKVVDANGEHYVSYSSKDGITYVRGATWTHDLGAAAKIGLIAFGGSGFNATFDYVKAYALP